MANLFTKLEELYFTEEELVTVLEVARVALESRPSRTSIGEWMDLDDDTLLNILSTLTDVLNKEG